jgi:hypothetical protein
MATGTSTNPMRGLGWGPFLLGFVPGLLQFQLGQKKRAAVAFASCFVLFFAGWILIHERLVLTGRCCTPDETGSEVLRIAAHFGLPLTLPEILNLPANALGAIVSSTAALWANALAHAARLRSPRRLLDRCLRHARRVLVGRGALGAAVASRWRRDDAEAAVQPGALRRHVLARAGFWATREPGRRTRAC